MALRARGRSKYGAVATVVDGIRFHSRKEARRYGELKLLVKARKIEELTLQYAFLLTVGDDPEWPDQGTVIGKYIADFYYYDVGTKKWVVEDCKGFRTPLYKWKIKHLKAQHGIEVLET